MMAPRGTSRFGMRRGFSLLEVQAAFLILGFSVAALFPFAVAQLKLVAALERRLPPGVTFSLVSRDHRIVNLLAAGDGTTPNNPDQTATNPADASQGPLAGSVAPSSALRAVVIEKVERTGPGAGDMKATVVVKAAKGGGN